MRHLVAFAALLLLGSCASAPEAPTPAPLVERDETPHVLSGDFRPKPGLSVDDLAFLAGTWSGTSPMGACEEMWSRPANGAMIGTFRLWNEDGTPNFYELLTLLEEDGAVVMRLKHFTPPDLVPWEEPAETTDFRLLEVRGTTALFGGLTLHRSGDVLDVYVAMRSASGVSELPFTMTRVRP